MHSRIRIAWFVTPVNFSQNPGGTWRRLRNWAGAFDRKKYEITLILGGLNLNSAADFINRYKNEVKINHIIILKYAYPLWLFSMKAARELAMYLKKYDIQIIHTLKIQSDIVGGYARKVANVPFHISSLEGALIPKEISKPKKLIYKLFYSSIESYINRFISVSEATSREAIDDYGIKPDRIEVVYSGIDLEKFKFIRKYKLNGKRQINIGTIGRLSVEKNMGAVIKAASIVLASYPTAKFYIVGSGPEENVLRKMACELNVNKSIVIMPHTNDVEAVLESFDIFLLTSIREGLPWVVLEAQAKGVPTIAASVGGVPEIIKDEYNGRLWQDFSINSLAELICGLLDKYEIAVEYAQRGRFQLERKFSISQEISEISHIYDQVMKNKKPDK